MLKVVAFAGSVVLQITLQTNVANAQDMSRHSVCASFGKAAATWERKAMAQRCRLPPQKMGKVYDPKKIFGNEATAYNWCMRTDDADFRRRSPVAIGHKGAMERYCTNQLRRTIRL